jgi:hypothetical protein
MDAPYDRGGVDPEFRPLFEQLVAEFAPAYQVWTRVENYGLWVSAGVVNPARRCVAEVEVRRGRRTRTAPLTTAELARVRDHLSAGGDEPLRFGI